MSDFTIKNLNLSSISADFNQVFNFCVPEGQCLGITGPSGIGKSILLKALADMLPHQGEVFLGDVESQMIPAPQWRRKVALLPAESQWWCDTVGEHFHEFDETLFAQLGFEKKVMGWHISHLSSGEKQRLACIRLLMNQPEALLLDEPTANLDKGNQANLESIIADYQKKYQIPVIWISHDKPQLERVCQQLLVMNKDHYELRPLSGVQS
ncbi:MAG: ABC transporter ATP-binding protein [gamma proteobacterium symbiont of Bathyaustriella thionipta]|nr:ABC transporter ATP-binding protein [gamma proteobacterium symbiont of Bathyaustriella thionipta]MCU7950507.1 ABC transporter ATP-binding protein [gamma proteobacterium symbiont of Bathyaustriella thionipta]MCU7953244.1 ABC transporter ATP-binding protein [gamma proteobacterium symbiont of Bathyaustriella thionipta]MCU7957001.1 ABC transporter ATP-binding protein [gamma proteobacterium symbiont of Bathyaustriella thionipta]MCU7965939.1 ABC transporter ATP-binding protein [gamma proteobacteri